MTMTRLPCVILILVFASLASAQGPAGLEKTWKGPDLALIREILAEDAKTARARPPVASAKRSLAVKFRPSAESGVARSLAEAFGRSADEKANLTDAFSQLISGFNAEMVKESRANDLAAALVYFVAVNVAAHNRAEMPSDAATEELYNSLAGPMNASSQFAAMSDAEKHQMHDWLAAMAGFVLTMYQEAKGKGDAAGMQTVAELAGYSMRLALGIDVSKLSLGGGRAPASENPAGGNSPIVGAWTAASSSPWGTSLGTDAGSSRIRYVFDPDGTYRFKSERWGGYMASNTWWTTEESGTYTVSGGTLTVNPRSSKATLRNSAGAVQKTQNNPLEKVTYKWTTHYFEGIRETNLVLEPPQKTSRDGVMGGNSLFPKAYLYKQGDALEWRY